MGTDSPGAAGREHPLLFEGVTFSYGNHTVLREASFEIRRGEFTCIVGPNGGGKSTLLRLALGQLQPTAGRIRVFGRAPRMSGGLIGYVPQHVSLDASFPATVMDVVLMGRLKGRMRGPFRREDRDAARAALEQVDLEGLENRGLFQLSGGQRQRVLIARALATQAALLFFDEPTSHVDRPSEKEIYQLLRDLSRERTIVLVSHDMGVVPDISDQVLCVNRTLAVHCPADTAGEWVTELYGGNFAPVDHSSRMDRGGAGQ